MLSAAAIIEEAERKVGVADTDAGVRGNLQRLLESLIREFPMPPQGEDSAGATMLMDKVNRLEGLKWLGKYPEIADEPIEAPVFLMGLPRSGTTYFQYLFDRDA